jgi:hypothetical protein
MSFNLANNIWGTNYIMWQPYVAEGATMRFRFRISAGETGSGAAWWGSGSSPRSERSRAVATA